MKRVSTACVIALGLVLGSGGAAMAGEVNGNGDEIPGRRARRRGVELCVLGPGHSG